MLLCDEAWDVDRFWYEQKETNSYNEILANRISPQLIKILYVCGVLAKKEHGSPPHHRLWSIRLLLDLSWDELRAVICPLREILADDKALLRGLLHDTMARRFHQLKVIWGATLPDSNYVFLELAKGFLRVMVAILNHDLDESAS